MSCPTEEHKRAIPWTCCEEHREEWELRHAESQRESSPVEPQLELLERVPVLDPDQPR